MLKALELVGFKSFADRTRFEFPPGITCIVGPNGSGKSNVVDAVKWVLGEQSVKSLRGKEMADVIFNGAVGRPPMNAAEATLTFDNAQKKLPVDTPDVMITRRVYRSGESEYLINKQPVRLRDIRDLFSGTGAATEAYSVIEQGKVDVLLQSSPKERRGLFEEAAGISRFKARKLETLRRLERVDQNLLRLHDIVEAEESRLKSVRNQAAKARRYKEHVERLQQLRTHTALADWRRLSRTIEEQEAALAEQREARDALTRALDAADAKLLEIDVELGDGALALRNVEAQASQVEQRLAAAESLMRHQRRRIDELEEEAVRHRKRLAVLSVKAEAERTLVEETTAALAAAEARHAELTASRRRVEQEWESLDVRRRELTAEAETERRRIRDLLQAATAADGETSLLSARLATLADEATRRSARQDELAAEGVTLDAELAAHEQRLAEAQAAFDAVTAACEAARSEQVRLEAERAATAERVEDVRRRQAVLAERADVLEDLLRRHEGLQSGVKEVLGLRESEPTGPLRHVVGLPSDLIRAPLEIAAAVDAALAERAQYIIVDAEADLTALAEFAESRLGGRAAFLSPSGVPTVEASYEGSPAGRPGVVGRLDLLVDFEEPHRPIVRRLLGTTWLVDTIDAALQLRREFPVLAFVTRRGECLTTDGALVAGRRSGGLGLIARRSELDDLHRRRGDLDRELSVAMTDAVDWDRRIRQCRGELQSLETTRGERIHAAADERSRGKSLAERRRRFAAAQTAAAREAQLAVVEYDDVAARRAAAETRGLQLRNELAAAETAAAALERRIVAQAESTRTIEQRLTAAKVEVAKGEERLHHAKLERLRHEQDRAERRRAVEESRGILDDAVARIREATFCILDAEAEAAEAYLRRESSAAEAAVLAEKQAALQTARTAEASAAARQRAQLQKVQEQLHSLEMAVQAVRLERTNLAERIRDDYALELAALDAEPATADAAAEREEIDRQIAELRRKINNIGNVNLEALAEVEELEARFEKHSQEFNDLSAAKKSLETIIARIDADSRRLFVETLETVKGYFQVLFRKLFGGGQADILLEEDVDILEAGIEIIARPPGKEPRNISLLSGGEKTLTCVALLLAVFQYRPSPFCVLDEVDAALDEANIGRFVGVLTEFLSWTQFIIVTHSKKTMTCGTTLYGVTMQESGISKRVAVRFEDVRDDGHIIKRTDDEQSDTDAA